MAQTTRPGHDSFLETAFELGAKLVRGAIWDGRRCNWITPVSDFNGSEFTSACGADFYGGTAGIAFFLASLYSSVGEEVFKTAALGAMSHALSRRESVSSPTPFSFHSGLIGLAHAAVHVGESCDEADLIRAGLGLAEPLRDREFGAGEVDVIGGAAGSIPALLKLHKDYGSEVCLRLAERAGAFLIETAEKNDGGWSWNTVPDKSRNLTGFAHGSSGIGHALLELHNATGEAIYAVSAKYAFAYERQFFDVEQGNWPDFRILPGRGAATALRPAYAAAWCHGAPGIAMARLRAFQLTGDASYQTEALHGFSTTRRSVMHGLASGGADFSLCHGLAGNADILLAGGEVELAFEVGRYGSEEYSRKELSWPSGFLSREEAPGLMLGISGVGYFYLRLADSLRHKSVLMMTPDVGKVSIGRGGEASSAAGNQV